MKSNSKEYWEYRFAHNWEAEKGNEQTEAFARILLNHLPEWLKTDISVRKLSVCDAGCANGNAASMVKAAFPECDVSGFDFAELAVSNARRDFSGCNFFQADITTFREQFDVIYTSNVLEHFSTPIKVIEHLLEQAKEHLIVMVPFQQYEHSGEHESYFELNTFPVILQNYLISCLKIIDTSENAGTPWHGKQLLVVYSRQKLMSELEFNSNDLFADYARMQGAGERLDQLSKEHNDLVATNLKHYQLWRGAVKAGGAEAEKKATALVKDAQEKAARAADQYAQLQRSFDQSIEKIVSAAESASRQVERKKVRRLLRSAGVGSAFLHAGIGEKFNILGKFIARLFNKNIKMDYADFSPYYILRACLDQIQSQALRMQNGGAAPDPTDPAADAGPTVPRIPACGPEPDDAVVDQLACIPSAVEKPRKKRIAYFTNQVVDWQDGRPRFGGGERYLLNLSNLLKEYGYEIDVYQPAFYEGETSYYGLPVKLMKAGECYSEFSLENADQFYEVSLGYDHVIYNLPEYSAGKVRKDALMMCHGIWFDHNNYGGNFKFRQPRWMALLRRAFNNPLKIVSVDTNSINVIRAFFPELSAKMTFIPNFVDTGCFQPPKEPRRNGKLKIIFPRRSQVNRGSRILGDILAQVPHDVEFYWVGEGDAEDTEIIRKLTKKDPRLHYQNATFEEMPDRYQAADIAVIPTLACEGTSLSCIEAMACGCATVATNVGGLPDIIFNEINGLCVDPTADALAQAINRLITDPELRGHLQRAGYEQAQRLSLTNWKEKWRAVLRQMKWIGKDDRKDPRVCIVTRNAIHGGVESLVRMEQESLRADVIVAGGHNDPYGTCPFRYRYLSTYKELLSALLQYDVVIYHWLPDWAVQAIAVSGVFSMEFVHRVDTAESSKTVPDLVLSHSQYVLDSITKETGRKKGMYVVPNGADLSRFVPTDHGDKKKIGALTSYYDTKGVDILIRAWQMMKPGIRGKYTLSLCGTGTDLEKYRRMIRPQDRIELNPATDEPEKVYGELFLYVTAARIEGLPVSILEAMACNLPVIASDIDGHRVINEISEAHGFQAPLELVPAEDPKALARAIEAYIQNPRAVNTRGITEKIFSGKAHCEGLRKLIDACYIRGDAPEAENA